jgi:hypothetical protein
MRIEFLVAGVVALCPALAISQAPAHHAPQPNLVVQADTTPRETKAVTSNGDVEDRNVTPAMIKAQQDPSLIGSPAWWRTHSTADGKPLSAAGSRPR